MMVDDDARASVAQIRHLLNLAMEFHVAGDLDRAEEHYLEVWRHGYRIADVLPLLAGIAALKGNVRRAITHWDELLIIDPHHFVGLLERGALLLRIGAANDAVGCFRSASRLSPENPLVLNNLAVALVEAGQRDEALLTFRKLAQLQPENIGHLHQIRRVTSAIVPFWHIPMLNDTTRNDAFEKAIVEAVRERGPEARILDIGAGSGLLSMMAARAGASNIVTCEAVTVVAEAAERIIAANGFEDRIQVINKVSTELTVGEDIDSPVDILISEILSSDLLAENVLSTFEDAHLRLLREGATVIPRGATAVGCLVESDLLSKYCLVNEVSGFDVSHFTTLAAHRLPIHGTMTAWRRLSPDIDLQTLDLRKKKHETELRQLSVPVSEDGIAIGIVQWMKIDVADGVTFTNHPDDYSDGGWLQVLHPFPQPMPVSAGSSVEMAVGHDRTSLILIPLQPLPASGPGLLEAVN